jgi:hypothetical protein
MHSYHPLIRVKTFHVISIYQLSGLHLVWKACVRTSIVTTRKRILYRATIEILNCSYANGLAFGQMLSWFAPSSWQPNRTRERFRLAQ